MSPARSIDPRGPRFRFLAALVLLAGAAPARAELPYEDPPIDYLTAAASDPIARLASRLEQGEVVLARHETLGYLPALLAELGVPPSSQGLVFSQTSFQRHKIRPRTPRAIYFGDEVYVGYVPGGEVLELSAADPGLGGVFYTLDQSPGEEGSPPRLARRTHDCLQCHVSNRTAELPGHLIRSVYPDRRGQPIYNLGTLTVDHHTPLAKRWGGWYVTGTHGSQRHLGNQTFQEGDQPETVDLSAGANVSELGSRIETGLYLTPHSDITALMVLEHQTQLHNLIARAAYEERLAAHYDQSMNEALGRSGEHRSESYQRRCQDAVEKLLEFALYCGEAPLVEPVRGPTSFASDFAARGPRDRQGRSLRELSMAGRMFRYPLSYLVYSRPLRELPPEVRRRLGERLAEVLDGRDTAAKFAHLSPADRRAIREILVDTQAELPAGWGELLAAR